MENLDYSFLLQASTTVGGVAGDYAYTALPSQKLLASITEALAKGEPWATSALQTLQGRCNSFTYAYKGFSSSIGYLAFPQEAANFLWALQDRRDDCTLILRQFDGVISGYDDTESGISFPKLYIADVQTISCGELSVVVAKIVDLRYWAKKLAPQRDITVATVPSGITTKTQEAYYSGTYGGDWNTNGQTFTTEVTIRQQLAYYWPRFRDGWKPTFSSLGSPWTTPGIQVYPDAESPWDICQRIVYNVYSSSTLADIYLDTNGDPQLGLVTPVPTEFFPSQETEDIFVAQNRKASLGSSAPTQTVYEVLFPVPGSQTYDDVSVPSDFEVLARQPYLNPARNPYCQHIAYYPLGKPSSGQECIQLHSSTIAIPKRKSGTTDGPDSGDNQSQFDDWDFDWAALRTAGDADYITEVLNDPALSRVNYRRRTGFDLGSLFPVDHTDYSKLGEVSVYRYCDLGDGPYTEYIYSVRPVIEETNGLPMIKAWQANASEYYGRLTKPATFIEELLRDTSAWDSSDDTEMKIYGRTDSGNTLLSSTSCQAVYGMGEAGLGRRIDGTNESGTRGAPETHVPVFSRSLVLAEGMYGLRRGDGLYHLLAQPTTRYAMLNFRNVGDGTATEYTSDPNIQVRFQAPTGVDMDDDTTAVITNPTPLLVFDMNHFSLTEVQARTNDMDSDIGSTLLPERPYAAFVRIKPPIYYGQTDAAIAKGASGTVSRYNQSGDTGTNDTVYNYIGDIATTKKCYYTIPWGCTVLHMISGECA